MTYQWEPELPALAALSDADAVAAINVMAVEVIEPIRSSEILAWSAAEGRFARVDEATSHVDAGIRSLAMAAKLLLTRDGTSLDLNLPDRAGMVDALVAAGVMTADDKTSLYQLATITRPKYSTASPATDHQVNQARARMGA